MKKDQCIKQESSGSVSELLDRVLGQVEQNSKTPAAMTPIMTLDDAVVEPLHRPTRHRVAVFDFDLAEFPLFQFAKRPSRDPQSPLHYRDSIRGPNDKPITREWTCYPGRLGIGGATAQALLFDLLQLYAEQGGRGNRIHFGTLRSLLVRRGERNPSRKDYDRIRRDFIILRGYDFSCRNAYWDPIRRAYADMEWRLFGAVHYFKQHPQRHDDERPFGFIELSPTFEEALANRGQFRLGFDGELFHQMPPLAQRLSLYLAKMFTYQTVHRRRVDDLATALPIDAKTTADKKKILHRTIDKLTASGLPILGDSQFHQDNQRTWWAFFQRGESRPIIPRRRSESSPLLPECSAYQVERIIEAVNGEKDRAWWTKCVRELGPGPIDRALEELAYATRKHTIRNPGGMLTRILNSHFGTSSTLFKPL